MLAEMPWEAFQEWREYDRLEPFGEERGDLRAGIIASTIANANRGKKTKPFKPADFMPDFLRVIEPPKPMSAAEFRVAFDGFKEMVRATAGAPAA
jgi:hypothetical protein